MTRNVRDKGILFEGNEGVESYMFEVLVSYDNQW
jgi:hypothetical protein